VSLLEELGVGSPDEARIFLIQLFETTLGSRSKDFVSFGVVATILKARSNR